MIQFKTGKLAPKNLKPLIKELPNRIVETADQVLLGLSHTKQSIPTLLKQTLSRIEGNPNDLVGRVGRSVLERAETVRKQLIEKADGPDSRINPRWVPDWLKDVSFVSASEDVAPILATAPKSKSTRSAKAKTAKPAKTTSAKPAVKKTTRAKKV